MSPDSYLKEDLIGLRKEMGLTQQQMADALGMALRAYQSIESGDSEYRFIHRLAAERVALMIAADRKLSALAPPSVRDDAIELVRVGRLTRDPAFRKARSSNGDAGEEFAEDKDAGFRVAYSTVGELVLLASALDHQLNHVLIQLLHLAESPMLEAVVATLDAVRKIEMLKERSKFIAQMRWQKPVRTYLEKAERVYKWRNIACHTPMIPDEEHGAVFVPTGAAKLLKGLQPNEPVAKRVPYSALEAAIKVGESALAEGMNLIENFQRINAERIRRFG